jgi:D-alanyl-D-alanine carboxypeptidase
MSVPVAGWVVPAGARAGLAPAMLAALARADRLLGRPVTVVSGMRTRSQQEALWGRRATNPYPVARPGTSDHERGLAIDVPRAGVVDLRRVARAAGLCQPLPTTDPIHFVVCGA